MKVKEVYVTRKNPEEMFLIIDQTLSKIINTQVFIDNDIFELLMKDGPDYHVFHHNYAKGYHYYHDQDNFGGEQFLELTEGGYSEKRIAKASFISNTEEYMQLVNFHSKNVNNYIHYLSGFNQLLLIHFEPEK